MDTTALIMLEETAREIDKWIVETEHGGWSTQNLDAMKQRSLKLWALIGKSGTQVWGKDKRTNW